LIRCSALQQFPHWRNTPQYVFMLLVITVFLTRHLYLLGPNFPTAPYSQIAPINVFPLMSDTRIHTHTKLQQIYSFLYFIFYILLTNEIKRIIKTIVTGIPQNEFFLYFLISELTNHKCLSQIRRMF
jgi:hypothetical protein